jgi:hypothetical protein
MNKIEKYLTEGMLDKRVASMKADIEKKYGTIQGKTVDLIYNQLMKVPDYKRLSMDRQGEIAMKVLMMIKGIK